MIFGHSLVKQIGETKDVSLQGDIIIDINFYIKALTLTGFRWKIQHTISAFLHPHCKNRPSFEYRGAFSVLVPNIDSGVRTVRHVFG